MDIFQTTKNQINRHVMDAVEKRLDKAKEQAANEHYSLPYEFLSDNQRLTLIDEIALRFAKLELLELKKSI